MTDTYKSYTFSMGESPNKRNYMGMRRTVTEGLPFAFEILNKWKPLAIEIAADIYGQQALSGHVGIDEDDKEQNSQLELQFILKICAQIDLEEVMRQGNKILHSASTQIVASEDNSSQSYVLSNEKQFNDWFEMHPSDVMHVYGYAIWRNTMPFIPSFMDKLKTAGAIKETLAPQGTT